MSLAQTALDALTTTISDRRLSHVKLGLTDLDGIMRGKYVAASDLVEGIERGLGFCSCIVGWDCDDQLYTNNPRGITGWHTGYPDLPIYPVTASFRTLPHEFDGRGLLVLAELGGEGAGVCPRGVLRRVVERALEMGYTARAGFEYEFSLFAETRDTVRSKHYRDLASASPGNFGYSLLRSANFSSLCEALIEDCAALDVPLVALHTENGPGLWEAAIAATDALAAADRATIFKTFVKAFAQRHGMIATFMAKPVIDRQGQGGHIHVSLRSADDDRPVFELATSVEPSGGIMRKFVAGQQSLMPEFAALVAPTINSYARLVPGAWAPTAATAGEDNRTCSLRSIGRTPDARRVEYRVPGADANPYLALAAALASGLHGLTEGPATPRDMTGNAYEIQPPSELRLPTSLAGAAERFRQSSAARNWFGEAFVEHFAASREWEDQQFRSTVTDWELQRYFEII